MSEHSKYQVRAVFDEALSLFERKNADYGDSWREQGWRGNLSRTLEKAGRMRKVWRQAPFAVPEETLRETALDTINTLAFLIVNLDNGIEFGGEEPPVRVVTEPATAQFTNDLHRAVGPDPDLFTHTHLLAGKDSAVVHIGPEETQKAIDPPPEAPARKGRTRGKPEDI